MNRNAPITKIRPSIDRENLTFDIVEVNKELSFVAWNHFQSIIL